MNIQLVILLIIIITYLVSPSNEKGKKYLIWTSCILFTIQSGFRHITSSGDTLVYYYNFWSVKKASWEEIINSLFMNLSEVRDPGYAVLEKIFSSLIPSWTFFCLSTAFLLFLGLGRIWARYLQTKSAVLFASVLWLALFNIIALSGMRQMITTALAFLITPAMEQKKWLIVIPTVLIGSYIHISFLLFLAFIPLSYIKKSYYNYILFIAIAMVPVVASISQTIMIFMVSQMANEYYQAYAYEATGAKAYTYVALCTGLSLFMMFYYRQLKEAPKFYSIAAVLMTMLVPLILRGGTAIRIGQYFTVYMMLSLPFIIERISMKKFYYTLMLSVLTYYIIISSSSSYLFFWDRPIAYIYGF